MKLKVLFLIESLSGGGAEKVLVTLLNNISKDKFDITLCTFVDTGVFKKSLSNKIKYTSLIKSHKHFKLLDRVLYRLKYKLIYQILPAKLVYSLYMPKNYDIEIAFVEGLATKVLASSTNRHSKKIAWVHIDLVSNHWIDTIFHNKFEEFECYKKFDSIIGVSNNVTKSIKTLYNLCNVTTLYNPIDSDSILKLAKSVKDKNYNENLKKRLRIRLVSVGRLVHQKGYDRLLRIFERLIEDSFDIELNILGEGPDRANLESFINIHGLNNRVNMPGFVENPYAYMSNCDLFVCSSRSEGYSTAVTEALILGLPVVTTNCSGMEELLNYGEYGIIADNNEDALFFALKNVLSCPDQLIHLKKQSEERGKYFTLENLITPIENLLIK